jgi:hypothetical protein
VAWSTRELLTEKYPWLQDPSSHAPRGQAFVEGTAVQALVELYNPAQLDVLYRVHLIKDGTAEQRDAVESALDAAEDARATPPADDLTIVRHVQPHH